VKLEKLHEGQIVYDVGRQKMGNTTISTVTIHQVIIVSIDVAKQVVTASWNGNTPRTYRENTWSKWRLTKPMLVAVGWTHRLATHEEIKAAKTGDPKP
jgi:hypothetical protein